MGGNVKEMRCFLVDQQNYLHPTASFFRQKQKVGHRILFRISSAADWFESLYLSVKEYSPLYLLKSQKIHGFLLEMDP